MQTATIGFYTYYDELIITVSLLQMLVSYDGIASGINGFVRSLKSLHVRLLWGYDLCVRCIKNYNLFFKQKKSEKGN